MEVVNIETAAADVQSWLDHKGVKPKKREEFAEQIATLVENVQDGTLVVNADFTITHKLVSPIGKEVVISSLAYKPRLTVGQVHNQMKDIKAGDADGRLIGMIAALTGHSRSVIAQLDTADYSIGQNIALFFL